MSNDNPPKPKRSFRVIFKIIKFFIAMALTFVISFAVTLYVKSDNPEDYFGIFADEIFGEKEIKSRGVPEIKTLFDEQNNRPFDPTKYEDADKKISAVENESARQSEELGLLDTLDRITSIKPAVDEKIKEIPNYVTLERMPVYLMQAIISVEDTRFYNHKGFDLIGIARAILVNVEAGQKSFLDFRPNVHAQGGRINPVDEHGKRFRQGKNLGDIFELDLFRFGFLRGLRRGARLFRKGARRPYDSRMRNACGFAERAESLFALRRLSPCKKKTARRY